MSDTESGGSAPRKIALIAPLAHRPFRALFAGKVISNLGDWLDILALLTLILYRWNLGSLAWGAYLTAMALPYAIVGPVAGVWVDRLPRRTVMMVCDLARAVIVLGLVWAPNLAAVLVLVTLKSTFSTFFTPAEQATIRSTVPHGDLIAANSLNKLSDNGARLIGPGLGGLILAVGGLRGAFVADSVSFLLSALILTRLPRIAPAPTIAHEKRQFWPEFRAGVVHIKQRRALVMAVSSMIAATFLIRATDTVGVVVLKDLGVTAGELGLSFTFLGVGYVAGAIVVGQWGHKVSPLLVMGLTVLELGSLMAMLGLAVARQMSGGSVAFFAAFPSRLLLGVGFAAGGVAYGAIVQRETPSDLMGRVSATTEMLTTIVPLVAPFVISLLAAWLGVGRAFAIAGGGLMIVGAVVVLGRGVPVGVAEVTSNE